MPDLLLELFSEEMPAKMQGHAMSDLKRLVTSMLKDEGLHYENSTTYVTPRRLCLHITGIPAVSPTTEEEVRGPRVDGPESALSGFIKSTGLQSISEAKIKSVGTKEYYFARLSKPGQPLKEIISNIVAKVIRNFPWVKSQRWGSDTLRWIRPLRSILAILSHHDQLASDGDSSASNANIIEKIEIPLIDIDGVVAGDTTYGHRFMAPQAISVRNFDDYQNKLAEAKVLLDHRKRKEIIWTLASALAQAQNLSLIEDEELLDEVTGLVEWPIVLLGKFDADFLELPECIVRTTIRTHQKCLVVRDNITSRLSNNFIIISNLEAADNGVSIVAGNNRVVNARLADARHFYNNDTRRLMEGNLNLTPLDQRLERLRSMKIIFHAKLGTQGARVARIVRLAELIAPMIGADCDKTVRAASLAKADLVTEVVSNFPELQGIIGGCYAELQQEDPEVVSAITEHYKPLGPSDYTPANPVAVAVAMADKLDTLVGFWAINEKPTGSRDPYQLRRAATGIVRIVLDRTIRIDLVSVIKKHIMLLKICQKSQNSMDCDVNQALRALVAKDVSDYGLIEDLMSFIYDRLKVLLRNENITAETIDAVVNTQEGGDLYSIAERARQLSRFLSTNAGQTFVAGYKRAHSILKAENVKSGRECPIGFVEGNLQLPEERALAQSVLNLHQSMIEANSFEAKLKALETLPSAVDAFFDKVMVNTQETALKYNRLGLLSSLKEACSMVADFSRICS